MKLSYQRTVSNKNNSTGEINTQRFYAEKEVNIDNIDPIAKQKIMFDVAKDLHIAGVIMLKQMLIEDKSGK